MNATNRIFVLVIAIAAAAIAALAAPAIAGAEETTLCRQDSAESSCPEDDVATHLHLETATGNKAKLLADRTGTVECDALFLGDSLGSGAPLLIHGNFTYTNCRLGGTNCTVTEESESVEIRVSKLGPETGDVTGEGEVRVRCPIFINCVYDGEGLLATATGSLSSSEANGSVSLSEQTVNKVSGTCPTTGKLDLLLEPLEKLYIRESVGSPLSVPTDKTALCTADEVESTCLEEHKPSSVDLKDSAAEFLTSILNSRCEGLISGTVGAAGKPQEVKVESKYSGCTNSCTITEISGGSKLFFLMQGELSEELAAATTEGLELFVKCGETVKCAFGPVKLTGDAQGALATEDNGHVTFSKASLGKSEGLFCPKEASLDALFVASSATYIREDYVQAPTSLCSKDEKSPFCRSENQLKSIDYQDKALEILTNLINVKCEGLASGTVGTPANGKPLEVKAELTYTACSGGCFVTAVSGPGKIMLERAKSEEAAATSEGFEIFVKCGTTIKCLLGPEKMTGTALGALTTGDNGHLTFTKVSMGKSEGATCPSEAKLDALFVASSAAYIG